MLLSETGFSFGGVHSRSDMGMIYAEKDGHVAIPDIRRNSYKIAGESGTVLFPGEDRQLITFEGSLYPAEEPRTQAEAQALLREVAAWLTNGRQRLIFDYEPEVFYLAELTGASKWNFRNWFGGELPIRFSAQPFAYGVEEQDMTLTFEQDGTVIEDFEIETGEPTPMSLEITNTGSEAITHVYVCGVIEFSGLSIQQGETLFINLDAPIGAQVGAVNALPYAESFGVVTLVNGVNEISVGVYGSGNVTATARLKARGRW